MISDVRRRVLAIDPGPTESAYVLFIDGEIRGFGKIPNHAMVQEIEVCQYKVDHLAIEMIASYGMAVGAEVFETCVWIGRFIQRAVSTNIPEKQIALIKRLEVKLAVCKSPKANDASIRQALIDRYGPGKEKAIGTKAAPGPLYHIKADIWAALALAVTWWDKRNDT